MMFRAALTGTDGGALQGTGRGLGRARRRASTAAGACGVLSSVREGIDVAPRRLATCDYTNSLV